MATFAETQLQIARKKAKYEKLLKSPNMAERTAAMMMYSRAVNAENLLFAEQESQKPAEKVNDSLPKAGAGLDILKNLSLNYSGNLLADSRKRYANNFSFTGDLMKDSLTAVSPLSLGSKSIVGGQFSSNAPGAPTAPGLDSWKEGNKNAALGNTVVNGLDYFSKMAAIRKMQAPPKPISSPMMWLNKNLNTGAERNAVSRNRISQERMADQIPGQQAGTALKQKAGVNYLNQLSGIYDKEQNFATQMENTETAMNSQIMADNVYQQNAYNYGLNDFNNNRIAARQGAASTLLGNTSNVIRDTRDSNSEMTKWDLLMKQYDPTVSSDVMAAFDSGNVSKLMELIKKNKAVK
jgi:hypothetical protein